MTEQKNEARLSDLPRVAWLMARALWSWKIRRDHKRMVDLLAQAAALLYPERSGMVKATEIAYGKEFNRGRRL